MTSALDGLTFFLRFVGGTTVLVRQIGSEILRRPLYFRLWLEQAYHIGLKSLPLVFVITASTGMVMALQFGAGLEKFGGKLYIPAVVSLSIVRELGPVLACLMLAARISAGITSEIGSMKVTQQIDAIRALGTSPIKKIVIPRVLAATVTIPLLCVFGIAVGILGGLMVSTSELGLDPHFYLAKVLYAVTVTDYMSGLLKTVVFAFVMSVVSCFYGLRVQGGTQGVGSATTKAVVTSCVFIMVSDFFLTKLSLLIENWI